MEYWVLVKAEDYQDCLFKDKPVVMVRDGEPIKFDYQRDAWDYLKTHKFNDYVPMKVW